MLAEPPHTVHILPLSSRRWEEEKGERAAADAGRGLGEGEEEEQEEEEVV